MPLSADFSLAAEKMGEKKNSSPAAFGIMLQNHRRLPASIFIVKIAALGSLSGLLEGFSKLVSN
jgi:hypothetical protein